LGQLSASFFLPRKPDSSLHLKTGFLLIRHQRNIKAKAFFTDNKTTTMSLQESSQEKPFKNFLTSLIEAYPDASMHDVAVLFTDVVGSTTYFKTHGDRKGREMLRTHHKIAISIVEEYGGSLIKEVGDSVMVYFPDAPNALKASIKMQHTFNVYNKDTDSKNEIHIRIGIHFGKVIVEEKDIYGDVVNVAAKLTNLANGDQIFISSEVYELTKDLPSVNFELINFWKMKNVPTGLTPYKVIWDKAPVSEPDEATILHLRFVGTHAPDNTQNRHRETWNNFIREKNRFFDNKHESEHMLPDGTFTLSYKDSLIAFDMAERLLKYLSEELKKVCNEGKPPVYMVIFKGTHTMGNPLLIKKSAINFDGLNPGDIYMSKNIYEEIKKQRDIAVTPPPDKNHKHAFYKYLAGNSEQAGPQQIPDYKKNVNKGILAPCFYCGDKNHYPKDCPSKMLTELTHAINEIGYLSTRKINSLSLPYHGTKDKPNDVTIDRQNNAYSEDELAMNCFHELKSVYQLRFFRTIWGSRSEEWEKAKKDISASEGGFGFVWLALDSFRVSNYDKAEAFLKSALGENVKDYKSHCIAGFFNIERNNLADALMDFDDAFQLARTNPQKIFIQLLQSRIYTLLGNLKKAQEKINNVLMIDPDCVEARYEDIGLKFRQKNEGTALQRLVKLIKENRNYYIIALLDPDMEPYSKPVNTELTKIFDEAKAEAQFYSEEANRKLRDVYLTLAKKSADDIRLSMAKIENMMDSKSYFGYLDIFYLGNSVISICNNALKEQRKSISETILRLNKRLERGLNFIRNYRYPEFSDTCARELNLLKSKMAGIGYTEQYVSAEQFDACHELCDDIAQELDSMEPKMKRLDLLQKLIGTSISFLKHSSIPFLIVLFVGVCLIPFLTDPINTILAKLDIFSITSASSLQKTFIILGGIIIFIISFLVAAKKNFQE